MIFIIFGSALVAFSCSSTQVIKKTPPLEIIKTTLAKGIEDRGSYGMPVSPSSTFTTDDRQIVSHIKYANLSGKHELKWEWYGPDNKLYQATGSYPIETSNGTWIKEGSACHRISIKGTKAAQQPGNWKVRIYLDGALAATELFTINQIRKTASTPAIPNINFGTYHAIVVGNNDYQNLTDLESAAKDAQAVARLLKNNYGFRVKLLINATREDIILALNKSRMDLDENDNLLIYYAGHGWLDKSADEGYWLPVDAGRDNPLHYVSNSSITSTLKAMHAKHVLVVADSCYSGKLTRGIHINIDRTPNFRKRIANKRARTVLCSGGLEPVLDSGGKVGHSVFAAAFMDMLKENKGVMDCTELFTKLRRRVMLNADQTPEYSDIRKAGHDGGDFLFVRQK